MRTMTPQDIFNHFGSQADAARALCLTRQAVNNWAERGKVPKPWQIAVEAMTNGELKRDDDMSEPADKARAA